MLNPFKLYQCFNNVFSKLAKNASWYYVAYNLQKVSDTLKSLSLISLMLFDVTTAVFQLYTKRLCIFLAFHKESYLRTFVAN